MLESGPTHKIGQPFEISRTVLAWREESLERMFSGRPRLDCEDGRIFGHPAVLLDGAGEFQIL